jgi:hypothetical protein
MQKEHIIFRETAQGARKCKDKMEKEKQRELTVWGPQRL